MLFWWVYHGIPIFKHPHKRGYRYLKELAISSKKGAKEPKHSEKNGVSRMPENWQIKIRLNIQNWGWPASLKIWPLIWWQPTLRVLFENCRSGSSKWGHRCGIRFSRKKTMAIYRFAVPVQSQSSNMPRQAVPSPIGLRHPQGEKGHVLLGMTPIWHHMPSTTGSRNEWAVGRPFALSWIALGSPGDMGGLDGVSRRHWK